MTSTPDTPLEARRTILDFVRGGFAVHRGQALPLGISHTATGLNFSVFSSYAKHVWLVLFAPGSDEPLMELPLDPVHFRTGNVWHIALDSIDRTLEYGWRVAGEDGIPGKVLLDPYAPAVTKSTAATRHKPRRGVFVPNHFDWKHVRPPHVAADKRVIYEMHVRGFTRSQTANSNAPGTFRGIIEKIPYLLELGVTTLELLPVYEFDEHSVNVTGDASVLSGLVNYWGYNPVAFFAPNLEFCSDNRTGAAIAEFKEMVRELHRAGIEVLLDVVFNHTAEGPAHGPTFSFRGLDERVYYMLDDQGRYLDYSGCGNTLNCNHPVVRNLIIDALRYWVAEMHVDGFRFDLASVLARGRDGDVLADPPLIEAIAADPILADCVLIAEAWDAAGLYQVGNFPAWGRWGEWNGPFRDEVRRYLRGERGLVGKMASRLAGSSDLYQHSGRKPHHSINFVTCHDGFTLVDLVSYNHKHNEANGEYNRDGADENFSWNCGAEGPTTDPLITTLRRRQIRNYLTILFLSSGTPMLLGGDELGRTQRGNNNAYCQDNDISWYDWSLLERNGDLFRFTKTLMAFRREHPVLRRGEYLTGAADSSGRRDVSWHGLQLGQVDWGGDSRWIAMHLAGEFASVPDDDVYFAANPTPDVVDFELPAPPAAAQWVIVIDTAAEPPNDIHPRGSEPVVKSLTIRVEPHSCVVLRSAR